jgi:hypothetical protein
MAFRVFRISNPKESLRIEVSWVAGGAIYQHNPYVDETILYARNDEPTPETMLWSNQPDYDTRPLFALLGITPTDARAVYVVAHSEARAVIARLSALGVKDGDPLIAIQLHGAWQTKRWGGMTILIERLAAEGFQVVVLGTGRTIAGDLVECEIGGPGIHDLVGQTTLREANAIIGMSSGFVGFDSALGWAALAMGVPAVSLWATYAPGPMIGWTAMENYATLGGCHPPLCEAETGTSCRTHGGGEWCPCRPRPGIEGTCERRDARPGANCLEEITVDEIMGRILSMSPPNSQSYRDRWNRLAQWNTCAGWIAQEAW